MRNAQLTAAAAAGHGAGVWPPGLLALALAATLVVGGCRSVDYSWTVWLSNGSDRAYTVEVSRPSAAGRSLQAFRLPPHSTRAAGDTTKGTDIVVSLYGPDCAPALTVPVTNAGGYAYIDPAGTASTVEGLTDRPGAGAVQYGAVMAISEGCSAEWKAANPGFTMPPATTAPPSSRPSGSSSAPAASATSGAFGVSVANGLTVPVTVDVNGPVVGTVAAGATQDWDPAALPAKPWAVEARSPSGRVLAALTVSASDYLSANSGRAALEDLACGRLVLWAGAPVGGGPSSVPDPSKPCD